MIPQVSIIIPTYNNAAYIQDSLNSVLKQRYQEYEIIIIDDGSTDNTKELLEPYLRNKRIYYFYQENKGLPGARNAAIRLAKGEYILCLDADDELAPDAIQKYVESAKNHNAQWVISDIYRVENNASEIQKAILPSKDPLMDILSQKAYFRSCFYTKKILQNVEMYDETQKYYEDWELYIRLIEAKAIFSYVDQPLYIYKVRKNSITKQSKLMMNFLYIEQIYIKHHKRLVADAGMGMRNLYAQLMWRLASNYLFKAGSFTGMLRCFKESTKYDSSIFKEYISKRFANRPKVI